MERGGRGGSGEGKCRLSAEGGRRAGAGSDGVWKGLDGAGRVGAGDGAVVVLWPRRESLPNTNTTLV